MNYRRAINNGRAWSASDSDGTSTREHGRAVTWRSSASCSAGSAGFAKIADSAAVVADALGADASSTGRAWSNFFAGRGGFGSAAGAGFVVSATITVSAVPGVASRGLFPHFFSSPLSRAGGSANNSSAAAAPTPPRGGGGAEIQS